MQHWRFPCLVVVKNGLWPAMDLSAPTKPATGAAMPSVEGYLSARLDKYGKPVCSGTAPPTIATGEFKSGSNIRDPL